MFALTIATTATCGRGFPTFLNPTTLRAPVRAHFLMGSPPTHFPLLTPNLTHGKAPLDFPVSQKV